MIDWPQPLKTDLVSQKVAIFVGAGVSKNSLSLDGNRRPPLWKEFLMSGLERVGNDGTRHIRSAINNGDYLHACEWIRDRLDEEWEAFLRSELVDPQYRPAEIHDLIFRLNQKIYLTPNFDTIFDSYATSQTNGQAKIKRYCEPDVHNFLRDDNMHVIKVHGSASQPNELIFSQRDYAEARTRYSSFYDALDACLLSHTFLFLGCGISDPDVGLLLENQRFEFPFARPHYFVTADKINNDLARSLRGNRNLKCLTYRADNNHAELLESLKELLREIDDTPVLSVFG